MDKFSSILSLSRSIAERQCSEITSLLDITAIIHKYKLDNNAIDESYSVLFDELIGDLKIREIIHSRLLYIIFQYEPFRRSFVKHFFQDLVVEGDVRVAPPDHKRIDLCLKSENFCIIIENKINKAPEQEEQIQRYYELMQHEYSKNDIYVMYLNRDDGSRPSEFSLPIGTYKSLGKRFKVFSYKNDILKWLNGINLRTVANRKFRMLVAEYKEYLRLLLNNQNCKNMNKRIQKEITESLNLKDLNPIEKVNAINQAWEDANKLIEYLTDMWTDIDKDELYPFLFSRLVQKMPAGITLNSYPYSDEESNKIGFAFRYNKKKYICCIEDDGQGYYWGIRTGSAKTSTKDLKYIRDLVLNSNHHFTNHEDNSSEWAISNYAEVGKLEERFLTLSKIIAKESKNNDSIDFLIL